MAKSPFYYNSVRGCNGINLNKFITFLFGVKPATYKWDSVNKTYRFFIDSKILESQKAIEMKQGFEENFGVFIVGIVVD